jgi:transposase
VSTLNDHDAVADTQEYAAWVGLDWADKEHFWSLRTPDGTVARGRLENTPEAIEVWACELARRFAGRPIAVALEQARGALIGMLSKYAHIVLFPVHPTTLAHYRKSFYPSGAKSDGKDSDLIMDLLRKHPERLRRLQPDTVETRGLQFLTEERRKLVERYTAESQRLMTWLKQVYPQILRWFEDPASALVGDLLLRWPTLQQLQKASPKALLKFFHEHNCRSEGRIEQRLAEIRQAVPATTDPALLETGVLCIQTGVQLLAQMRAALAAFDRRIAAIYYAHPDRAIMQSLPGAGPALEPRLIAAIGSQRDRFHSATSLACFSGIAPVKETSGESCWVHWRCACPKFIRQTFHEWARCSIQSCQWARTYYDQQRSRGKGHHAAVRALAFKWIRILFRCWKDRIPYCEQRYVESLRARAPKSAPAVFALLRKSRKTVAVSSAPAQRFSDLLHCLAARIRALCASKQPPGNALRDGLARTAELLSCLDQASLGCRASYGFPGLPRAVPQKAISCRPTVLRV